MEQQRQQEVIAGLASRARVAQPRDAVLNTECCYTFHSPFTSPRGIVVNLATFAGTVQELSCNDGSAERQLCVRIVEERVEKSAGSEDSNAVATAEATKPMPTKLGVGVEGGFSTEEDKYEIVSRHSIVVMEPSASGIGTGPPTVAAELPYEDGTKSAMFPPEIVASADSVLCHAGLMTQQDVQSWQLDDEVVPVSKYAESLPFVDNGVAVDPNPKGWRCQKSGEASDNLWLNLSTGYIGGGRKNWDGSGGSNGALDHFHETGNLYPLVVKLGTISSDLDAADCYSYAPDEDGPVKVPNLPELLQRRGINVAAMQKTVKSTAELEVELNATYAFDAITESGSELVPVTGPGLQGLQNLGNSCYINSVLQALFSVPELADRYGTNPGESLAVHPMIQNLAAAKASADLLCQTAKVASALTSGAFCPEAASELAKNDPKYRLAPRMFKHAIAKDHPEFRTGHQQDAEEFLRYFLGQLDRAEMAAARQGRAGLSSDALCLSSRAFEYVTTDRLVCAADGKVKYEAGSPERIWSLPIPMEKARVMAGSAGDALSSPDNKRLKSVDSGEGAGAGSPSAGAAKEPVPTIPFATCVEEWASGQADERRWPHLNNARHGASKQTRFSSFPRYLIVQMLRYTVGPDWTPIKLEVNVDVPEEIDLEPYRSTGPADGEDLVPSEAEDGAEPPPSPAAEPAAAAATGAAATIDENALTQLMDMGFTLNSCKRALTAVGGTDVEAAMNWVFEHNMDPDFNDPLPAASGESSGGAAAAAAAGASGVDEGVVQSLVENLGCFTADQVRAALKETGGAADRAADWLFSHMDDLDGAIAALERGREERGGGGGGGDGSGPSPSPSRPLDDGPGRYALAGMISHIGKNTGSGHYVAHLKKGGRWVIFNDEKVALSSSPPYMHAYLYLFERKDAIAAGSATPGDGP